MHLIFKASFVKGRRVINHHSFCADQAGRRDGGDEVDGGIVNMKANMTVDELKEKLVFLKEPTFKTEKQIEKYNNEYIRLKEMRKFEDPLNELGIEYIAGIDEAGRGPLAGPVVAGAVILPPNLLIEGLNDSKKVSPKKREMLFDVITENATAYGVGIMNEKIIDDINILQATRKAMIEAVCNLETKPQHLLVDAEKLDMGIPFNAIISGDALSLSIAAASIIAKVTRDRMMMVYDEMYPEYGFAKHKGYGTREHIEAIKKYGPSPIHRMSFLKNIC